MPPTRRLALISCAAAGVGLTVGLLLGRTRVDPSWVEAIGTWFGAFGTIAAVLIAAWAVVRQRASEEGAALRVQEERQAELDERVRRTVRCRLDLTRSFSVFRRRKIKKIMPRVDSFDHPPYLAVDVEWAIFQADWFEGDGFLFDRLSAGKGLGVILGIKPTEEDLLVGGQIIFEAGGRRWIWRREVLMGDPELEILEESR